MKNLSTLFVICAVACCSMSFAQYPDWINYTNGQAVHNLSDNGNELWIGADLGGLVKFDKTTEEMTFYNHANSGLPHNYVSALATDGSNVWVGTYKGLAKFDGSNWTEYYTSNSGLPGNTITAITIDGSNIWIGTAVRGLAKFDGSNWTTYDTSNSRLPDNHVSCLEIDGDYIWALTGQFITRPILACVITL